MRTETDMRLNTKFLSSSSLKNLFKNPKQYLDESIWKYLHDVSAREFFSDVFGSCRAFIHSNIHMSTRLIFGENITFSFFPRVYISPNPSSK